eukprot:1082885-Amphidinium_carterae.1
MGAAKDVLAGDRSYVPLTASRAGHMTRSAVVLGGNPAYVSLAKSARRSASSKLNCCLVSDSIACGRVDAAEAGRKATATRRANPHLTVLANVAQKAIG